jgi:pimeloyl-ACP methyl ester carboxylesterase
MINLRRYGRPLYDIVVIHGGPGAVGEMAPVAAELSKTRGVLEPLFYGLSVEAQLAELRRTIEEAANGPVALVGHSWGAWLAILGASTYPELVKQAILISCPPLAEAQAAGIAGTRLARLSQAERDRFATLTAWLDGPDDDKNALFRELAELIEKADNYDPLPRVSDPVEYRYDVFAAVWPEATRWRRDARWRTALAQIDCPVVAVHGDYDPHPAAAISESLSELPNAVFVALKECGHTPWRERLARRPFFELMAGELLR